MTTVRWLGVVGLWGLGCTPFTGGQGSGTASLAESTEGEPVGTTGPQTTGTTDPMPITSDGTTSDATTGSTSLATTTDDATSTSGGEVEPFFRRVLTIEGDQVPDGAPLVDFNVLVVSTGDEGLRHVESGGHVLEIDAADLVFRDESLQPLARELVAYAPDTGRMAFWVRVPAIADAADTTLYLDYGAPSLVGLSPQDAWSDDYVGVWHFEDAIANGANVLDSSPAGNDGVAVNMDVNDGVPGYIGRGVAFAQPNAAVVIGGGALDLPGPITFEGWARMDGSLAGNGYQRLFNKGAAGVRPLSLWVGDPTVGFGQAGFVVNYEEPTDYVELIYAIPGFNYLQWHHYAGVVGGPGGDVALFVDGVRVINTVFGDPIETGHPNLYFGNWDTMGESRRWTGALDEFRFSTVARTDAWILASFRTQANPLGFCTMGPEEALP